jgi:hypothetical protein
MVTTVAPPAVSAATVRAVACPVRTGSNPARRVSLMPTTTLATCGRSSSALGSWSRSTCLAWAPLTARLCSWGLGSPEARWRAQPFQPPPGAGSPMPRVIESPSVTIRVMSYLPGKNG